MVRVCDKQHIDKNDIYRFAMPINKEIISHLQEHGTQTQITEYQKILNEFLNKIKKGKEIRSSQEANKGTYISSNSNYVKR